MVADTINQDITGRARDLKDVKNRHAYVSHLLPLNGYLAGCDQSNVQVA
jgi:hypothetical protein